MIAIQTTASAEVPTGSPFIIDRCPFRFGEQIDLAVLDLAEDKILNWPMVYILANRDSAYVGQTTSVATRMSQHGASEEKRDFEIVNIIFNEEFNASVVTDYEHHRLHACRRSLQAHQQKRRHDRHELLQQGRIFGHVRGSLGRAS